MIMIRGTRLPDPTGGLTAPVDIHVSGTVITAIVPHGSIPPGKNQVIEGASRIALPGFIDAHAHADTTVFQRDVQLAMLRQGITSIITGQDGVSFAPSHAADPGSGDHNAYAWASNYFAAINGPHPTFTGGSVSDLLDSYDGHTALNVGYLVPHGTLRYAVMGDAARAASRAEIDAMSALLSQGLTDGACGFSTGLEHVPAAYAVHEELTALARIVAHRGLPHVSHMRGYGDKAGQGVAELTRIALESGVATHISHYHGPGEQLIGYLDSARSQGVDMTFDSYPYVRGTSILAMIVLPPWLPIGYPDATLRALQDPTVLALLHSEHLSGLADTWHQLTLATVPGSMAWTQGKTLGDVAARLGISPAEAAIEILVSSQLHATAIFDRAPGNNSQSVRMLLRHRAHMAGSGAFYGAGKPHPRGWGAFARLLSVQVRKLGDWTWAEAEHHLSGAAARRFGLSTRGALRPGQVADIILVDPRTISDVATYESPRELATGIDDVLVGGTAVLARGQLTGATPGSALRPAIRPPASNRYSRGLL